MQKCSGGWLVQHQPLAGKMVWYHEQHRYSIRLSFHVACTFHSPGGGLVNGTVEGVAYVVYNSRIIIKIYSFRKRGWVKSDNISL